MDFIKEGWEEFVNIDFSRQVAENADIIVKECEKKVEYYGEQWIANVIPSVTCILIKPGDTYKWHFDNLNWENNKLTMPRTSRFFSEITYLTTGSPLQIGNFNGLSKRVYQTEFSAPVPTEILAEIYPVAGKRVTFPSFMVHQVVNPTSNRWAIVRWINDCPDKNNYTSLWKKYFGQTILER